MEKMQLAAQVRRLIKRFEFLGDAGEQASVSPRYETPG
jgi:hypothetical protein